jgi:hypothetical protein
MSKRNFFETMLAFTMGFVIITGVTGKLWAFPLVLAVMVVYVFIAQWRKNRRAIQKEAAFNRAVEKEAECAQREAELRAIAKIKEEGLVNVLTREAIAMLCNPN